MLKLAVIGAQTLLGRELVQALEAQECSVLPLSTGPLTEAQEMGDLVVFARSPEFPRALELVRGNLSPRVAERLREVLIEASRDPAAAEALAKFFRTTAFLPVDPRTRDELDVLRSGALRVTTEVE